MDIKLTFILLIASIHMAHATFELTSSSFNHGQPLPLDSGWKKGNKTPTLSWKDAPQGTKSFALIVDDPDAPQNEPWVHWVVFSIPAVQQELVKPLGRSLDSNGIKQGINSYGEIGYDGPHPPSGVHRYFFKLYALDTLLESKPGSTKKDLEVAMKGHILAEAQLMGTYKHR